MKLRDLIDKRNEIASGHINELKSKIGIGNSDEEKVFNEREKICNVCPLKNAPSCDTQKWINPETLESSNQSKPDFVRGCGCRLSAKQKSKYSKCPAGFWGGEFE